MVVGEVFGLGFGGGRGFLGGFRGGWWLGVFGFGGDGYRLQPRGGGLGVEI